MAMTPPSHIIYIIPGAYNTVIVNWSDMGHIGSTTFYMIESDGEWRINRTGISDNNARVQGNKIKLQLADNQLTAILFCCLGREFVSIAHFGQEFDTHQAYFLLGVIIAQLFDCLVERV